MTNTLPSLEDLKKAIAIREQIEELEAKFAGIMNGAPSPKKKGGRPKTAGLPDAAAPKKRGVRGALKERILAVLDDAGKGGMAVKDIAAKLGVKSQNVHVWFHSTGKKLAKRVGPGTYALS